MAYLEEDIVRLVQEVRGQQGVDDLRRAYDLTKGSLDALSDSYRRGDVTVEQYAEHARTLRTRMESLTPKLDEAKSKLAGMGQSFLQSGRAIQDFAQGGIPGILNNIEGITQAMGGGAGLAGVLTVVGVAAYVATPAIKALWASLTEGQGPLDLATATVDKLKEHIKELNEKPLKFAVDRAALDAAERRLDELQKNLAKFKALGDQMTADRAELAKAASEAVVEGGGPGAVAAGLAADPAFRARTGGGGVAAAGAAVAAREAELADARRRGLGIADITRIQGQLDIARRARQAAILAQNEAIGRAATETAGAFGRGDEGAIGAVAQAAAARPGAFRGGFLDRLGAMPQTEDEVRQRAVAREQAKGQAEAAAEDAKRIKDQIADEKRQDDKLAREAEQAAKKEEGDAAKAARERDRQFDRQFKDRVQDDRRIRRERLRDRAEEQEAHEKFVTAAAMGDPRALQAMQARDDAAFAAVMQTGANISQIIEAERAREARWAEVYRRQREMAGQIEPPNMPGLPVGRPF